MDKIKECKLWEMYVKWAKTATQRGDLREAEELLAKVHGELSELVESRTIVLVGVRHMMADLYRDQGRYAEAEPLYVRCMEMLKAGLGGDGLEYASVLRDYAMCLSEQGRFSESLPYAVDALSAAGMAMPEGDERLLEYLSTLSNIAFVLKRFAEGETAMLKVLKIREQHGDGDSAQVASVLGDLGRLAFLQEKYAQSEHYHRQALAIWRSAHPGQAGEVANCLNDLGLALCAQGKHYEAQPLCSLALSIREADGIADTAASLAELADVSCGRCRFEDAKDLCDQSFAVRCGYTERADKESQLVTFVEILKRHGDIAAAERTQKNLESRSSLCGDVHKAAS